MTTSPTTVPTAGTRTGTGTGAITAAHVAEYHERGFTVVRDAFDEATLQRFERAVAQHPPLDQAIAGQTYPGPGRWTLARNAMADPELAFIMARPEMVEPMRAILEDDPKIIMFAWYDRTPGGQGLPAHNDYKRWRPIGSSMRWAFAIVPFCDFDETAGRLEMAPGSHRVEHSPDPVAPVLNAARPRRPADDEFVDPQLRRGDLAIMDMHCWHRAGANNAAHHRQGLFTKWCAASHPPATGWFPYNDGVRTALGPDGEHVLGFSSPLPITATAALLERVTGGTSRFLFLRDEAGRLHLPTGGAEKEGSIPDWDEGNYVASLTGALDRTLRFRPPWMTYVGDHPVGAPVPDGLARTYAYRLSPQAWGVAHPDAVWLDETEVEARRAELAYEWAVDAIREWLHAPLVRGKAVTEAQGRSDQYAC